MMASFSTIVRDRQVARSASSIRIDVVRPLEFGVLKGQP